MYEILFMRNSSASLAYIQHQIGDRDYLIAVRQDGWLLSFSDSAENLSSNRDNWNDEQIYSPDAPPTEPYYRLNISNAQITCGYILKRVNGGPRPAVSYRTFGGVITFAK